MSTREDGLRRRRATTVANPVAAEPRAVRSVNKRLKALETSVQTQSATIATLQSAVDALTAAQSPFDATHGTFQAVSLSLSGTLVHDSSGSGTPTIDVSSTSGNGVWIFEAIPPQPIALP